MVLQAGFPPCFMKEFQNLEDLVWEVVAVHCWKVNVLENSLSSCFSFHRELMVPEMSHLVFLVPILSFGFSVHHQWE